MKKLNDTGKISEITDVMSALSKASAIVSFLQRKLNFMTKNFQESLWVVDDRFNVKNIYLSKLLTEQEKKELEYESYTKILEYIIDLEKKDINIKDIFKI